MFRSVELIWLDDVSHGWVHRVVGSDDVSSVALCCITWYVISHLSRGYYCTRFFYFKSVLLKKSSPGISWCCARSHVLLCVLSAPGVVMGIDTLLTVSTLPAVRIAFKAALLCLVPSMIVDYFFYQKVVVAVANIFLYNSNARTFTGVCRFLMLD